MAYEVLLHSLDTTVGVITRDICFWSAIYGTHLDVTGISMPLMRLVTAFRTTRYLHGVGDRVYMLLRRKDEIMHEEAARTTV